MKKKVTALALVICLLAVAVIGGTMAYFTDTDKATNTFTVGDIEIDLYEIDPDGNEIDLDDDDEENGIAYENLLPGIPVTKEVYVENTGTNDAYVRLRVYISNGLNWLNPAYGNGWSAVEENFKDMINDTLGAGWAVTDADLIFSGTPGIDLDMGSPATVTLTYTEILGVGETTPAAFKEITLPSSLTEDTVYSFMSGDGSFKIKVIAEAIQADGFAAEGTTPAWETAFTAFDAQ